MALPSTLAPSVVKRNEERLIIAQVSEERVQNKFDQDLRFEVHTSGVRVTLMDPV